MEAFCSHCQKDINTSPGYECPECGSDCSESAADHCIKCMELTLENELIDDLCEECRSKKDEQRNTNNQK